MQQVIQDINKLSVEELETLQKKAAKLIALKKEKAVLEAYQKIVEIAEQLNLSVEEIMQAGVQMQKKDTRKVVEPKYRNTENHSQTWSGRGKQPRWLVVKLEQGHQLEEFLI